MLKKSIKRSVNEKQLEFVVSELETNWDKSNSFYLKAFLKLRQISIQFFNYSSVLINSYIETYLLNKLFLKSKIYKKPKIITIIVFNKVFFVLNVLKRITYKRIKNVLNVLMISKFKLTVNWIALLSLINLMTIFFQYFWENKSQCSYCWHKKSHKLNQIQSKIQQKLI